MAGNGHPSARPLTLAEAGSECTTGKNRIMIFGPNEDGTYVVEFRSVEGDVLAISIPRTEAHVIRHFQEVSRRSAGSRSDAQALPLLGIQEPAA